MERIDRDSIEPFEWVSSGVNKVAIWLRKGHAHALINLRVGDGNFISSSLSFVN